MPKSGTSAHPAARCPRCGYDLTGHVEAWTDYCPTQGQCSECGLKFNWCDLLNEQKRDLPWLYEHAPHWWSVRYAWRTAIRVLAPWSFWKRVELHHEIRPLRLLLWLPCALVIVYAIAVSVVAASLFTHRTLLPLPAPVVTNLNSAASPSSLTTTVDLTNKYVVLTTPEMTVRLPIPRYTYFEPILYDSPIGPVVMTTRNTIRPWRVQRLSIFDSNWKLISPRGEEFSSPFTVLSIQRPYAPPQPSIREIMLAPLTGAFTPNRASYGLGTSVANSYGFVGVSLNPSILAMLASLLVSGCVILAAPSEWRRRRVRTVHLIRVIAYAFAPLAVLGAFHFTVWIWAEVGLTAWNISNFPVPYGVRIPRGPSPWVVPPRSLAFFATDRTQPIVALALVSWLALYWWFALKRGMKLESPFLLWFFVVVGGLLGYIIALNALDTFFTHLFI